MADFRVYLQSLIDQESRSNADEYRKGAALYNNAAVSHLSAAERFLAGVVRDEGETYAAEIEFFPDRLTFGIACECDLPVEGQICAHILAASMAFLYRSGMPAASAPVRGESGQKAAQAATLRPQYKTDEIENDYRRLLESLTVKQMRDIGARRGLRIAGLKREAVLEALAVELARPENLHRAISALSADARRTLDLIRVLDRTLLVRGAIEQVLPYLAAALAPLRSGPGLDARTCVDELALAGLVFLQTNTIQIPLNVWAERSVNPDLFTVYTGGTDRQQTAQPFQFSRLALRLGLLGQAGMIKLEPPARVDGGGWPLKLGEKMNNQVVSIAPEDNTLTQECLHQVAGSDADDQRRADLAARVLDAGAFWKPHQPARLTEHFTRWLQQDPVEQSRTLLNITASLAASLELDEAEAAGGFAMWRNPWGFNRAQFIDGLVQARLRLVRMVEHAPAGQWLEIDSLLRVLHGLQVSWIPELLVRFNQGSGRKIGENALTWIKIGTKTLDLLDYDAWSRSFGLFYLMVLTHTLAWQGLVDIGWQGSRAVAFRLTEFGENLLGRNSDFRPSAKPAGAPALHLDDQLGIVLDPDTADPELVNLVLLIGSPRVRTKTQAVKARPVQEIVYDVQLEGLGDAFEAGWDLKRINAVLEDRLGKALPDRLAGILKAVWERYGRLHLYENMAIVELADDFALPELMANTSLNQFLLYTFSPRTIAVRPDRVGAFLDELRARGYTPRLELPGSAETGGSKPLPDGAPDANTAPGGNPAPVSNTGSAARSGRPGNFGGVKNG